MSYATRENYRRFLASYLDEVQRGLKIEISWLAKQSDVKLINTYPEKINSEGLKKQCQTSFDLKKPITPLANSWAVAKIMNILNYSQVGRQV